MTNKWTAEEEIKLVNDISKGKTFSDLKDQYNRTELALELRLKKIIYENINAGKTASSLAKSLKLQEDKIKIKVEDGLRQFIRFEFGQQYN